MTKPKIRVKDFVMVRDIHRKREMDRLSPRTKCFRCISEKLAVGRSPKRAKPAYIRLLDENGVIGICIDHFIIGVVPTPGMLVPR